MNLSIRDAIRIARAVANAIRSQDFESLKNLLLELAVGAGLTEEVIAVQELIVAFQSKDLVQIIDKLGILLNVISGHLQQPKLHFAIPPDAESAAAFVDQQADHLMMHVGHRGATSSPLAENLPGAARAVNPATILLIIEAIITAIKWWRDRQNPE